MNIGTYKLNGRVLAAPMAGVTDRPFRQLCRKMGASLAVSEMLSSNPKVWDTEKSKHRMDHYGETGIRAVQIAGSEPEVMAYAAKMNVENGAQIIDINMGCPAKKVNKKLAGSALMKEPALVEKIIKHVVEAVDVPVTLKIRTGWDTENRNGVDIAKIAESNGIVSLAVHGRTRSCMYKGEAEYETIRRVKEAVSIPVVANGDIDSPKKAEFVLSYTGADAVMVGRAAQGRPWIFREIDHYLKNGTYLPPPEPTEVQTILLSHVLELHQFYGQFMGTRIARKHVGWYLKNQDASCEFKKVFNQLECPHEQIQSLEKFFERKQ